MLILLAKAINIPILVLMNITSKQVIHIPVVGIRSEARRVARKNLRKQINAKLLLLSLSVVRQ